MERYIDQGLRFLMISCFAACLLVVYLVAPLFSPHSNSSEGQLIEKCLGAHGFPVFDGWTGVMAGCER